MQLLTYGLHATPQRPGLQERDDVVGHSHPSISPGCLCSPAEVSGCLLLNTTRSRPPDMSCFNAAAYDSESVQINGQENVLEGLMHICDHQITSVLLAWRLQGGGLTATKAALAERSWSAGQERWCFDVCM